MKHGFDLEGKKCITLPYADDFCLITTNKKTHQRIMDLINSRIQSLGMKLKPSKCRSFSITSGTPNDMNFDIQGTVIPTIFHEEQKFLGKVLFPLGKSKDTFIYLKTELLTKLENIEKSAVRNEFKLWIYKHYFLPSVRFILTVHDLTKTDQTKLDALCTKYVKKWTGLPPCATNSIVHMKTGLDIMSIPHVYSLSHSLAHSRTRLQGDAKVNHALDCKIQRESQWFKKKSTVCSAQGEYNSARSEHVYSPEENLPAKVKETIKKNIALEHESKLLAHTQTLVKQGHLLSIAALEKSDAVWKSYMFDLKKGTMKFLLNACLDTLPTKTNLLQWGKTTSDLCKLCLDANQDLQGRRKETTHHILNGCKVSLNQQRYTWRHDNILKYICENVDSEKYQLNADIDGYSLPGGGTISPNLCVTPERPDIVIHDRLTNELCIFELTVPLETNILNAHTRKAEKYSHFIPDITSANVKVIPFEIGSRGYISPDNKTSLKLLFKYCSKETTYRTFMKNISAISLYSSYYIFIQRKSHEWDPHLPPIRKVF